MKNATPTRSWTANAGCSSSSCKGLPEAISFKDLDRRYIRLNDAERTNLGIPDDVNVIGRTSDAFVDRELAVKRCAEEESVLTKGEPLVGCIDKDHRAGGYRAMAVHHQGTDP